MELDDYQIRSQKKKKKRKEREEQELRSEEEASNSEDEAAKPRLSKGEKKQARKEQERITRLLSQIVYKPGPNLYPEDEVSEGEEQEYTLGEDSADPIEIKRFATKDERKELRAKLQGMSPAQLFPFTPIEGGKVSFDPEQELEDEALGSKKIKPTVKKFRRLGGGAQPLAITRLENRWESLVARNNAGMHNSIRELDDKKKGILARVGRTTWQREWEDPDYTMSQPLVQKQLKMLRRILSVTPSSREKLAEVMQYIEQVEKTNRRVPYTQLRQKSAQMMGPMAPRMADQNLKFITMDDDNEPLNEDEPLHEAFQMMDNDAGLRRVSVPYTYDYQDQGAPHQDHELSFKVTQADGFIRRYFGNLRVEGMYSPEPLQVNRISQQQLLEDLSFLPSGFDKDAARKEEHDTRESKHLAKSLGIKAENTRWTESSYLTVPQQKYKDYLMTASNQNRFRTVLRMHPQSHSNTPDIARAIIAQTGVEKAGLKNALTSVVSKLINDYIDYNDDYTIRLKKGAPTDKDYDAGVKLFNSKLQKHANKKKEPADYDTNMDRDDVVTILKAIYRFAKAFRTHMQDAGGSYETYQGEPQQDAAQQVTAQSSTGQQKAKKARFTE